MSVPNIALMKLCGYDPKEEFEWCPKYRRKVAKTSVYNFKKRACESTRCLLS